MNTPIKCEARLMGLSKTRRKDGDWVEVKFHIHPNDHPAALFILPLGTDCMLSVEGVPDETTTAEPAPADPGPEQRSAPAKADTSGWSEAKRRMVAKSGILRNEESFQNWIANGWGNMWNHERNRDYTAEEKAAHFIRTHCIVESCTDLDPEGESGRRFKNLVSRYIASQHGQGEQQADQRRDGYGG